MLRSKLITPHRQSRQFLLWQAAQPTIQHSTLKTQHCAQRITQHRLCRQLNTQHSKLNIALRAVAGSGFAPQVKAYSIIPA